ncbi:putative DNA polymerase III [Erwinia phage vB_EamM_Yoloswag]|uniref:Putative DNA polymerase III n=1 Tax=Erwinia phage vB_EamM_Yoloswag TaxID=1958956 RepID=A0A1S6L3E7_9CAUD|nr:clamp loader of DNA polymerase [Erwinia phage vB_EamM_Yoloswag]AQT28679.1 putative DNA polymerase III [Erwinia phage vB_EamM_Yoloswag]
MAKVKKRSFGDDEPKKKKKGESTEVVKLTTVNFAAKYRPRVIADYVGQDHIVKIFRGWTKSGIVPATILVTGHYGSGKTTFARLIAKYINCDSFSACGKCQSCRMADMGKDAHPDIMQYDMGGDHGKVDGSQKIIDSATLSPMFKRRVFILDEAHLMSPQAESKFLVTTEEPPEHTVWIFVTTNPEKMKPTIVSRATNLPIQPIKVDVIAKRLTEIADTEGILPKKDKALDRATDAIQQVAEYAGGQMRGAIGMLQTIYSSVVGGEKFDKELVNELASADPEIEMEAKAVSMIGAYLDMDLIAVIQFLREANNPRAIVMKARWVIHGIIGHMAETNKWQTAGLKMFLAMAKQNKIEVNPVRLIYLQRALADAEVAFNNTSVPADIMLESLVTTLMADLYSGKMSVEVVPFDTDADKSEKKVKKKKKRSKD